MTTKELEILAPEDFLEKTPPQRLKKYKSFLNKSEKNIQELHKNGASGLEVAKMRSDLIDHIIETVFEVALQESEFSNTLPPISIIATGGYGRAELNPGSDIDIHFLTEKSGRAVSKKITTLIENILYPLWDLNFKVGHATRSVKEELLQSKEDTQTCSSLIDARKIAGREDLLNNLQTKFYRSCIRGKSSHFLEDRLNDRAQRYAKYDNTPYLQEPNVKQGVGGLRDYHNLRWMTYYVTGENSLEALLKDNLITKQALEEIEAAHEFLQRVRNDLHYSEKPPGDILTLRLQGRVATHLKYPQKTILRRIEAFMKDYYLHTRNMLQRCDEVFDNLKIGQRQKKAPLGAIGWLSKSEKNDSFDGFTEKDNRLWYESPTIFEDDAGRIMRTFLHSQLRGLRLSVDLLNLIYNIELPKGYQRNKDIADSFEEILSRKGSAGSSFRQMHRCGFLGKYIPEFGAMTCLVQHEFFHRYTADEHTLTCLDILDTLSISSEEKPQPMADLYRELDDPFSLHLALLLHDSGRAANLPEHADASALMASTVCKRLGLAPHRRQFILFLVDNHLSLWHNATTKDIDDPETVKNFANIVKNQRQLEALLVMTYVDAKGTSTQSWTSWKETLILSLYRHTSAYLKNKKGYQNDLRKDLSEIKGRVSEHLSSGYAEEIDAHFEKMPITYFQSRDYKTIGEHIKAVRGFLKQIQNGNSEEFLQPFVRWIPHSERGYSEVIVVCWDRHALLARIAGAFAASKINVLGADVFQRTDDLVIDIFRVCTENLEPVPSAHTQDRFDTILRVASTDTGVSLKDLLVEQEKTIKTGEDQTGVNVPQRVLLTNSPENDFTTLQIQVIDRIGLLYDLFRVIGLLGHEVTNARIATEKGAAIDTFYIKDSSEGPVENLSELQEKLEELIL